MTIYSAPTAVGSGEVHHNMEKTTWATKDLLKVSTRGKYAPGQYKQQKVLGPTNISEIRVITL